jgi:hypothetical protein
LSDLSHEYINEVVSVIIVNAPDLFLKYILNAFDLEVNIILAVIGFHLAIDLSFSFKRVILFVMVMSAHTIILSFDNIICFFG